MVEIARCFLGTTSPTGFRSIQVWYILYFVMLLSECFTKVVYPHVRNRQFPTFIVLTDTSKHTQQIFILPICHLFNSLHAVSDTSIWNYLLVNQIHKRFVPLSFNLLSTVCCCYSTTKIVTRETNSVALCNNATGFPR